MNQATLVQKKMNVIAAIRINMPRSYSMYFLL